MTSFPAGGACASSGFWSKAIARGGSNSSTMSTRDRSWRRCWSARDLRTCRYTAVSMARLTMPRQPAWSRAQWWDRLQRSGVLSSIPLTRKSQVLSEIPLFASLSENEVQALAQRAVERRFDAGEMLFWEGEPCAGIFLIAGEPCAGIFLIAEGSVKIFK